MCTVRREYICVQECARVYKSVHKCTRVYICVQECTYVYKSVQECTRVYQSVQECTRVYTSVQECTRVYKSVQECTRVYKSVQECTIGTITTGQICVHQLFTYTAQLQSVFICNLPPFKNKISYCFIYDFPLNFLCINYNTVVQLVKIRAMRIVQYMLYHESIWRNISQDRLQSTE